MNIEILQKCLAELSKPYDDEAHTPNISYIRGMLETLIAMTPKETTPDQLKKVLGVPTFNSTEASIPARNIPPFVKDSLSTS